MAPVLRLAALAALLAVAGCDSGSFVPPRPAELSGEARAAAPVAGASAAGPAAPGTVVRQMELLAAPCSIADNENVKAKALALAGLEKVRIHVTVTGEKGSDEPQPALVRKLAARKPPVLILEPADPADPELARAVDVVRTQGIPVVVMGHPLTASGKEAPGSAGMGRIINVVPQPFSGSAPQLVAAVVNNARNIGFKPDGGAVLLIDTNGDRLAGERTEALRSALKAAGVGPIKDVRFGGEKDEAVQALVAAMKANPELGMVVSNDHVGLTASVHALTSLDDSRNYVVAGYTTDESSANMTRGGEFAAAAVYSSDRLLRKAITTAASLARGEKIPDRVELMVVVNVSPSNSGAPRMYRAMATKGMMEKMSRRYPGAGALKEKEAGKSQ